MVDVWIGRSLEKLPPVPAEARSAVDGGRELRESEQSASCTDFQKCISQITRTEDRRSTTGHDEQFCNDDE